MSMSDYRLAAVMGVSLTSTAALILYLTGRAVRSDVGGPEVRELTVNSAADGYSEYDLSQLRSEAKVYDTTPQLEESIAPEEQLVADRRSAQVRESATNFSISAPRLSLRTAEYAANIGDNS